MSKLPEVMSRFLSCMAGGVMAPLTKNRNGDEEKVWREGELPSVWN